MYAQMLILLMCMHILLIIGARAHIISDLMEIAHGGNHGYRHLTHLCSRMNIEEI